MRTKIAIIAAAIGVSGCFHMPQQPVATFEFPPFDPTEDATFPKTGTGVVRGQVFAKTVGGEVKKGAGNNVVMFPANRYGEARYQNQVIGGMLAAKPEDPRFLARVSTKVSDGDGRFEFNNIPPGTYYIVSHVTWDVVTYSQYLGAQRETQGGRVHAKIEVKDGATTEIMLTR